MTSNLVNEIKELEGRLSAIDNIKKINLEMSNIQFEQRKENSRKSIRILIGLKQAYLDGYNKAVEDVNCVEDVEE